MVTKRLPKSDSPLGQLRLEYRDPKELKANEKNWRQHPRRQRQAYQALKSKVGWAGACLYNEATGRLVDGHMRVDEAIKNKESVVPVLIGSWDEAQENLLLAQLDPIGALASTNQEALASLTAANEKLLTDLSDDTDRRLAQLNQDLQAFAEQDQSAPLIPQSNPLRKPKVKKEELKTTPSESDSVYVPEHEERQIVKQIITDDVRFASSDTRLVPIPLQIPDLRSDLIATVDMLPEQTFNRSRKQDTTNPATYYCISAVPYPDDRQGGTLGFFSEDYRFNHVWSHSADFLSELIDGDWTSVVTPDFSTYDSNTFPEKLWAIYRSRWCGRYWQEMGIFVIPCIQHMLVGDADMTIPVTIETLPKYCPTIALQTRSLTDYSGLVQVVNYAIEHKNVEGVLIYGGESKKKYLHGYLSDKAKIIYLPDFMSDRKRILKREE
jgi:hypothetical protein